jgi:hypothetical protein
MNIIEMKKNVIENQKEKIKEIKKQQKETYDDVFPKEYGRVGTTEDIYKIRDDLDEKEKEETLVLEQMEKDILEKEKEIDKDNLELYYRFLSDEQILDLDMSNLRDVRTGTPYISTILAGRILKIRSKLNLHPIELDKNKRFIFGINDSVLGQTLFGIKDELEDIDLYINKISNSDLYKEYLKKEKENKNKKILFSLRIAAKGKEETNEDVTIYKLYKDIDDVMLDELKMKELKNNIEKEKGGVDFNFTDSVALLSRVSCGVKDHIGRSSYEIKKIVEQFKKELAFKDCDDKEISSILEEKEMKVQKDKGRVLFQKYEERKIEDYQGGFSDVFFKNEKLQEYLSAVPFGYINHEHRTFLGDKDLEKKYEEYFENNHSLKNQKEILLNNNAKLDPLIDFVKSKDGRYFLDSNENAYEFGDVFFERVIEPRIRKCVFDLINNKEKNKKNNIKN